MEAIEHPATPSTRDRRYWVRTIAYWTCSAIIAWEMTAGSMWDLLRIEYVRAVFAHLGYPVFLLTILGAWKLPCAIVIMVPRVLRLKEWAYAGAVFNYTGAAASHFLVGDDAGKWIGPLVFALITLASWALRPANRRLERAGAPDDVRIVAWIVPLAIVGVFLVLALLTLPKGATP